tara:strand:+ start:1529 stop:2041 length:513 start_codon:yes stop_codon:yes gene_type:complete
MVITKQDIITELNGVYSGIPTSNFIVKRDKHVEETLRSDRRENYKNANRRWDCEFPENDIINHYNDMTIYEGMQCDNTHKKYGNIDFKQFAKIGVKLNDYPQIQVKNGITDYFAIWKWSPNNFYPGQLQENVEYSYEIIGLVPALLAVECLFKIKNENTGKYEDRFTFLK